MRPIRNYNPHTIPAYGPPSGGRIPFDRFFNSGFVGGNTAQVKDVGPTTATSLDPFNPLDLIMAGLEDRIVFDKEKAKRFGIDLANARETLNEPHPNGYNKLESRFVCYLLTHGKKPEDYILKSNQ